MYPQVFKTKAEFARDLGLSVRTLYRRLNKFNYKLKRELLSPDEQKTIYGLLTENEDKHYRPDSGPPGRMV